MLVSNLPKPFHVVTEHQHLFHHHTQPRAIKFMDSSKKAVNWVTLSLSFLDYVRILVKKHEKTIVTDCSGAGQCLTKMKSFSKNLDWLEMIGGDIANITQNFDSRIHCWESRRCCCWYSLKPCRCLPLWNFQQVKKQFFYHKMGVSKNRGTPKGMVYNGKPY